MPLDHVGVGDWLERHGRRPLLRLITCGSVDDGKSTLLGRLLHDTRGVYDDQLAALARDSASHGTRGGEVDYALLLDGLEAEREQGITIDVAWRYFSTPAAAFIVADCPGHEQYTRNMATGASMAQLAVVLVDARKGVLPQTRRHSWICHLFGVGQVVLAVNKMDAVGRDRAVFDRIVAEYRQLAAAIGIGQVTAIPVVATEGGNLVDRDAGMDWYDGPTLVQALEAAARDEAPPAGPFRLPVQWVCRPDQDFRGYAGTLLGGPVAVDDAVVVLPSGRRSRVSWLGDGQRPVSRARAGQAVMLQLADAIDVGRGDVIAPVQAPPEVADQFQAHLLWMDEAPLLPGRRYRLRMGTAEVDARVGEIRHQVDVDTQEALAARRLELNAVAVVHLDLERALPFQADGDPALRGFILVDRESHQTVGLGRIDFALRRARNLHWQALDVDKGARARIKGQKPVCVWLTGLSGSGKSTIANRVEQQLLARGHHTYLLDGDNVRHGLNRDLGFTDEDRVENIRRVGEVARLMVDAGLIVLVSFISPFRAEREAVRARFGEGEFVEVFVDAPLAVCEQRDPKGLYARARRGEIPNFTGIGSAYEPPPAPDLRLDTTGADADALATRVVEALIGGRG